MAVAVVMAMAVTVFLHITETAHLFGELTVCLLRETICLFGAVNVCLFGALTVCLIGAVAFRIFSSFLGRRITSITFFTLVLLIFRLVVSRGSLALPVFFFLSFSRSHTGNIRARGTSNFNRTPSENILNIALARFG